MTPADMPLRHPPAGCMLCCRGDHGAGVPESTPKGVYDFCRSRSRTRGRIFELKPDPEQEQEWEFQFLQESD